MRTYWMKNEVVKEIIQVTNLNRDIRKDEAIFVDPRNTPVITWDQSNELKASAYGQEVIAIVAPGDDVEANVVLLLKALWKEVHASAEEYTWLMRNGFIPQD